MSNDGGHKTAIVVGVVAAAAGIAVASYFILGRVRAARTSDGRPLRSVRDVLTDAYSRMRELQDNLSDLNAAPVAFPQR